MKHTEVSPGQAGFLHTRRLWVPSYTDLGAHPKTRKLARRLGVSIPATIGHLHLLWHWALVYCADGDLSKIEPEDIADGARFEGEPTDFLEALISVGFVDQTEAGRSLHDWLDYAGRLIATRSAAADAGSFGNHQRWHVDRGVVEPKCPHCKGAGESGGDRGAIGWRSGGDRVAISLARSQEREGEGEGQGHKVKRRGLADHARSQIIKDLKARGNDEDRIEVAIEALNDRLLKGKPPQGDFADYCAGIIRNGQIT